MPFRMCTDIRPLRALSAVECDSTFALEQRKALSSATRHSTWEVRKPCRMWLDIRHGREKSSVEWLDIRPGTAESAVEFDSTFDLEQRNALSSMTRNSTLEQRKALLSMIRHSNWKVGKRWRIVHYIWPGRELSAVDWLDIRTGTA